MTGGHAAIDLVKERNEGDAYAREGVLLALLKCAALKDGEGVGVQVDWVVASEVELQRSAADDGPIGDGVVCGDVPAGGNIDEHGGDQMFARYLERLLGGVRVGAGGGVG